MVCRTRALPLNSIAYPTCRPLRNSDNANGPNQKREPVCSRRCLTTSLRFSLQILASTRLVATLLCNARLPERLKKRLWQLRTTQRDLAVDVEKRHAIHTKPT